MLWWLGALSVATLLMSALLLPLFVARMPADYFVAPPRPGGWRNRHPAVRLALRVLRNVGALVLLVAGFAMLFLPGQGILTMLMGLMLLDIPLKRRLELLLVKRRGVLRAVNWLRRRAKRPPLLVP